MQHPHVWNMPRSSCGMVDSVAALVCAYLNCTETLHIRGVTSRGRGNETKLMWIGLLIIVGLLVIAACVSADITPPDLF
jgi:hypothetical protein